MVKKTLPIRAIIKKNLIGLNSLLVKLYSSLLNIVLRINISSSLK